MSLPKIKPIVAVVPPRGFPMSLIIRATIIERKFDGDRGLLYLTPKHAWFRSREDRIMHEYQELADQIRKELPKTSAILDGEIVVIDPITGNSVFGALRRRLRPFQFMAFDLMYLNGKSLVTKPLIERKQNLLKLLKTTRFVRAVDFIDVDAISIEQIGHAIIKQVYKNDWEGVMVKKKTDLYSTSTRWYKIKSKGYNRSRVTKQFLVNTKKPERK